MTIRQGLSTGLIAVLLMGMMPATARAEGSQPSQKVDSARLHAAITRAAAQAASDPALQMVQVAAPRSGARMQSTGGGHTAMVLSIVGTLVGVAATVYMVKQVQKTTKTASNQNQ